MSDGVQLIERGGGILLKRMSSQLTSRVDLTTTGSSKIRDGTADKSLLKYIFRRLREFRSANELKARAHKVANQ